ncbi:MAG: hypothetical protein K1X88_30960 [Nannocystaceae bacterium]|nr:hypothetical protein [Nannocystaceae bacterium]
MALLLVLAAGCKSAQSERHDSARVTAPDGSRYTAASAHTIWIPATHGMHASSSEHVQLRLVLEREGEPPLELQLDDALRGDEPGDASPARWQQLRKPAFDLRFAPDGHALALSLDGGSSYELVALDLGEPLYCAHEHFVPGDDFAGAPSSRRVALDVLASADPPQGTGTLHLVPGEYPRARERFVAELAAARAWACSQPQDAELREAVVAALVRPGSQIFATSDETPLVRCVAAIARDHAELRAPLLAALERGEQTQRTRAALALAHSHSPEIRETLLAALSREPVACSEGDCIGAKMLRLGLAYAIAAITTALGDVPPALVETATAWTREPETVMQILGIRTLAHASDPRALARLDELAAAGCSTPLAWRDDFDDIHDDIGRSESPACWASAAAARLRTRQPPPRD